MQNNKQFLIERKQGDAMRKWSAALESQIINEVTRVCPQCSAALEKMSDFYRCKKCYSCWELNKQAIEEEMIQRIVAQQLEGQI